MKNLHKIGAINILSLLTDRHIATLYHHRPLADFMYFKIVNDYDILLGNYKCSASDIHELDWNALGKPKDFLKTIKLDQFIT